MDGVGENGLKWLKLAGNGWKQLEPLEMDGFDGYGWNWPTITENF